MGSRLLAFRDRNGWDTVALAGFLRCDGQGLARLVFHLLPDAGDAEAIAHAAALTGCDPDRLACALDLAPLPALPIAPAVL
jgi:hypothetical protein